MVGQDIIFSSEIRGILKHPKVSVDIDKHALAEYFTFQNFFNSRTLFSNVSLIEPGYYLTFNTQTKKLFKERYWDFTFSESTVQRRKNLSYDYNLFTTHKNILVVTALGCYFKWRHDSAL